MTDENGEFAVELPAGDYRLTAASTIDENFVAYLKFTEKGLNPTELEFTVRPSLKCCRTASGTAFPKVINIPKPNYPPAARAVHTEGEVVVSVKVDKDGKVTSAQVISGHPLLRQASELAAKQGLFETSEESTEREANLSFVFVIPGDKRKEVKHYSNPYRTEVIPKIEIIINTMDTKY